MILNTAKKNAKSRTVAIPLVLLIFLLTLGPQACNGDVETDPPIRRDGTPRGTLAATTTQVTLSLRTEVDATCKYSSGTTRVEYDAMPFVFTNTGGRLHTTVVDNLVKGEGYNYYVRCRDQSGITNSMDYAISFNIAASGPGDSRMDKILFIGNSYTGHSGGIHNHLHRLMAAAGKMVQVAGEIHGGEAFSYKNKRYRGFLKRKKVLDRIKSQPWDAVILQSYYEDEEAYYQAGSRLIDLVRKNGSEPLLFMIWGHEDYPEQDQIFRYRAEHLGKKKKVQVVPIGIGIRTAHQDGLQVYADGSHLSLEGTYLAAAMFYSFFTKKSPEGLSYHGIGPRRKLNARQAKKLQRLAWEVIKDYGVYYKGQGNVNDMSR